MLSQFVYQEAGGSLVCSLSKGWGCPAGHLSRSTRLRNANALRPLGVREGKVEGRGELRLFALHSHL